MRIMEIGQLFAPAVALAFGMAAASALAAEPVIEFYNANLDHYFVTISVAEADGIDRGAAGPGWHRTARVFGAYADAHSAPPDAVPVCRFYGNVAHGGPNSHFYTADPLECAAVQRDPGWLFEGIAFHARLPVAGECPAATVPVLRNYNRRFAQGDSNHRYTTDRDLHDEMAAIGWATEGTVMCADAGIATPARAARVVVSGLSGFTTGCEQLNTPGILYVNAEVEPYIAVNPRAPDNLIGVWQQDRWNNGSARGVVAAASFDGGRSWQRTVAPFSRCTGGTPANGGDFRRATDPWVTFSPNGTAFQIALAVGRGPQDGSINALAVSRSRDGGITWDTPIPVRQDGDPMLNDKESITADPTDARFVYAIWDRVDVTSEAEGPTWFARTTDGGDTWEPARIIYEPGAVRSTLNNQIVVLPDGTLINFFTEFDNSPQAARPRLRLLRSGDKGVSWSAPVDVATAMSAGTRDPETGMRIRDGANLGQITVDRQGRLFVVWQDARTAGDARDAVLISRSTDGGLTWSAPAQVSPDLGTQAFTPAIAIARDGTIGVTYYDLRSNTADPATLPTDYWLARSTDGVNWSETHVDGPFDLAIAPNANGLFLGDYQGLATIGNTFVPFYARTNTGNATNRTDIVAAFLP